MPTATPPAPPRSIDTGRVAGRRTLRFNTPAELDAEVLRLVAADRAGTLKRLGNWSLGQTLNHLGVWTGFAFTGNPLKPPFFVRWIVGMRKTKYLNEGLPAGVKIPKVEGGTLAIEPVRPEEGLSVFNKAWDRLKREAPTQPNVIFGKLSHQEWTQLNLRHAELHLSFLVP